MKERRKVGKKEGGRKKKKERKKKRQKEKERGRKGAGERAGGRGGRIKLLLQKSTKKLTQESCPTFNSYFFFQSSHNCFLPINISNLTSYHFIYNFTTVLRATWSTSCRVTTTFCEVLVLAALLFLCRRS